MRIQRMLPALALLLGAAALVTGCITIPTMADRVVELVTTGSTTEDFHASGVINTYADSKTINASDLDIARVLDDAGIDLSDATAITFSNLAWRVTAADASPARTLTGKVAVSCEGRPFADLVNPFSANAGAVTDWHVASLQAAGVAQVNTTLATVLQQVKNGQPVDATLTYAVSGTSAPVDVASDFHYELRLTVNIQGKVKTQMLTGR